MKKTILFSGFLLALSLFAQHPAKDWYLKYSPRDTMFGIDLIGALKEVPKPDSAREVIVAVIDGGTDNEHEDLISNIWINKGEKPENGLDDDGNGYIDDIYGWDFIGGSEEDVSYDNLELTRLVRMYRDRFVSRDPKTLSKAEKVEYKRYLELKKQLESTLVEEKKNLEFYSLIRKFVSEIVKEMKTDTFTYQELESFNPKSQEAKVGKFYLSSAMKNSPQTSYELLKDLNDGYDHFNASVNYQLNLEFDPRVKVEDNYSNQEERYYGNNEVIGPDAKHGTHVAGIIAAMRNNKLGNDGVATMAKIMVLRVVPNGDERDKDVANAIRYAVDNGAKVINMSFGKAFDYNKAIVDEAVRYAESKDVLIIHAAGNDAKNTDKESNFPSPRYKNDSLCKTWIEVGASQMNQGPASFSNYGKKTVNVFAPGFEIYNTVEDDNYEWLQGTSMAAPVVAGLAALIRSYYPHLTAIQVKQIIESTVEIPTKKFVKPGSKRKKIKYKKLCTSKGVVNAKKALISASKIK